MPYADANGVRLYYEVHGDGEPLLLHPGFGCTVEIFWANTPQLAERVRVIVFDPRGAGRSHAGDATSTMKTYADDAAGLLDALGVESAHVLGTSFGGMVAQHIALEHPQRVRRLVLGCTTAGGAAHILPPIENIQRFMAASDITDPVEAVRSTYFINYSDEFCDANDSAIVERAQRTAHLRSTPEGRAGQINAVQGHDTLARLGEIAHPTLVAHGTHDGTVPVENGRAIAAHVPNARFIAYPGARHLFFIECATRFNADVAEFLLTDDKALAAK